jgi:hypothetical protein
VNKKYHSSRPKARAILPFFGGRFLGRPSGAGDDGRLFFAAHRLFCVAIYFFKILNGSFKSIDDLKKKINEYFEVRNETPQTLRLQEARHKG